MYGPLLDCYEASWSQISHLSTMSIIPFFTNFSAMTNEGSTAMATTWSLKILLWIRMIQKYRSWLLPCLRLHLRNQKRLQIEILMMMLRNGYLAKWGYYPKPLLDLNHCDEIWWLLVRKCCDWYELITALWISAWNVFRVTPCFELKEIDEPHLNSPFTTYDDEYSFWNSIREGNDAKSAVLTCFVASIRLSMSSPTSSTLPRHPSGISGLVDLVFTPFALINLWKTWEGEYFTRSVKPSSVVIITAACQATLSAPKISTFGSYEKNLITTRIWDANIVIYNILYR